MRRSISEAGLLPVFVAAAQVLPVTGTLTTEPARFAGQSQSERGPATCPS